MFWSFTNLHSLLRLGLECQRACGGEGSILPISHECLSFYRCTFLRPTLPATIVCCRFIVAAARRWLLFDRGLDSRQRQAATTDSWVIIIIIGYQLKNITQYSIHPSTGPYWAIHSTPNASIIRTLQCTYTYVRNASNCNCSCNGEINYVPVTTSLP